MQNYKNHIRYYVPHHFVFYPVVLILLGIAITKAINDANNSVVWAFMAVVMLMIGWLAFMLRQHYALTNQNHIVIVEMRFRYYVLTHERLELLEDQLSFGQIAALRFASDEELPALVQKALKEKLNPDQIKKSIVNWFPDHRRV